MLFVGGKQVNAVNPGGLSPNESGGAFTVFDLIHLIIRDGSIAGMVVVGWTQFGWLGIVAGVPVGWVVGWILRYVIGFTLAVGLKLVFGGRLWPAIENRTAKVE